MGGRVEFSWDAIVAMDGAAVSYRVHIERVSDGVEQDRTTISATSTTSHTFTGLDPVTEYRIEVVATALNYRDSEAGVLEVTTTKQKLPAPTGVQISHTADMDSITVSWTDTPPAPEVTTYEMTLMREDGTGNTTEEDVVAAQAGSTTFTGVAGTAYILSVVSSGDSTKYRRSDAYQTTITTTAEGQLERPVLTLTMEEDDDVVDIVVSWVAIVNATTYEVNLSENPAAPGDEVIATQTTEAAVTTVRFEDVLPGRTYDVVVIAESATLIDSEEGCRDYRDTYTDTFSTNSNTYCAAHSNSQQCDSDVHRNRTTK